jgi:ribosomal protein L24E
MIDLTNLPRKIIIHGTEFYVLTGYETLENTCWWCGKPIEQGKRLAHYCRGKSHDDFTSCYREYHRHFDWTFASDWALKRSGRKCQFCGKEETLIDWGYRYQRSNLEVHHIVPLKGSIRVFSIYNAPCNLVVLCRDCHLEWHDLMSIEKKRQVQPAMF